MEPTARHFEIFLDVQSGLARQGPGSDASTLTALELCRLGPGRQRVIDIGCGPGMQTLALATALDGRVIAVDINRDYLDALAARACAADLASRIGICVADMRSLPFAAHSFDLVWAEGSAYIMGFGTALGAWNRLLGPGGCIAVSELVWLRPGPPAEIASFFAQEYPAMADATANLAMLDACGYVPLGHITLPDADWWTDYYAPLEAKLPQLRARYAEDAQALDVVAATAREIEMRRRYGEWYGYQIYVGRKAARG